jgi:hypothetical protein
MVPGTRPGLRERPVADTPLSNSPPQGGEDLSEPAMEAIFLLPPPLEGEGGEGGTINSALSGYAFFAKGRLTTQQYPSGSRI